MRNPHRRFVRGTSCSVLFVSLWCAALMVTLPSCSANFSVQHEAQQGVEGMLPPAYSIVCVIHGDGDYLYHDTSGYEHDADEEALAGAQQVAQHNPHAEMFIFYQKPKRHFMLVFPLRDGEFYYYRNGRLMVQESYWRDQELSQLGPEAELYRRYHADNRRGLVSMFLYYGHEIPEFGGAGYDASYPDRPFTVHDLAVGLNGFTRDSTRFDLMILSTCFGGTPYTISTVGSYARYVIASPDNLHLSYLDLHSLQWLHLNLQENDVHVFAQTFARRAFDRLTRDLQTAVSVAVYNMDSVQEYVQSVHKVYDHTLRMLNGENEASTATTEHCDCADLPAYVLPTMKEGVEILYRPARFGRTKDKLGHSGWECWKVGRPQAATSQIQGSVQK